MTSQEATTIIRRHSTRDLDIDQLTWPESFLGSLRPFVGLREENFHEVMNALRVLAPSLRVDTIDRELMSDLWNMCWQASLIGLHSTGALQRNGIITVAEIDRLESWIFQICFTISLLLEGADESTAFAAYDAYGSA